MAKTWYGKVLGNPIILTDVEYKKAKRRYKKWKNKTV